jgi:DNA-binding CsgD family transcriptional regulator
VRTGPADRELFGRDEQIAIVHSAIERDGDEFRAVVLTGQAGIGKTAIWESGLAAAISRRYPILQTRAAESEARLSHGGLSDLLEHVPADALDRLPPPLRRAVDAALLRADSGPNDPRALGAAFLAIVRDLCAGGRILIAIDDDQWLDEASTAAAMYALRRLRDEPVTLLLTRRTDQPGSPYGTEGLVPGLVGLPTRARVVDLTPLRPDAIRRLVGRPLPPRLARRVYDMSGGNPFFALEIADALRRADHTVGPGDELPVPTSLHALISARLDATSPGVRLAVLVTSLVNSPRLALIRDVLAREDHGGSSDDDLDRAVGAGLVVVRGEHVRLAHPLIGAVARAETPAGHLRRLHRAVADTIADIEERAWHRALGATPPNAAIADELVHAADVTADRGGMRAAAELSEQAWRFTPPDDPRRDERLIAAANRHYSSGRHDAGAALLTPQLALLPPGPVRARASFLAAQMRYATMSSAQYDTALAEADPRLRAEILAVRATSAVHTGTVPVSHTLPWVDEAVEITAGVADPAARIRVVTVAAWMDALLGDDPEPRLAVLAVLAAETRPDVALHDQSGRLRALRAMWRGDVGRAREILNDLQNQARERGEEWSVITFAVHLFETAIRVGDWNAAARARDDFLALAGPAALGAEYVLRTQGAVAAGTGDRVLAEESMRLIEEMTAASATERSDALPLFWHDMETRRTAGQAALFDGDAETAAALLAGVVADAAAAEYRDPGVFPAGPDLVEALVKAGRLDDARDALRRFEQIAVEQDHPWALAGASRARGILLSVSAGTPATENDGAAEAAFTAALDGFRNLDLPFDEARTVAALGTLRRRQRRYREARALLEDAAERYERLGALGLARGTREEAVRAGRPAAESGTAPGELTATERQVVDLVVAGCTNRQAADRLFISVSAVEAHLTRVYAKLGVASRTQMIRKLSGA